jgi:hypothetical protein
MKIEVPQTYEMYKQAIKKTLGKEHIERHEQSTEGNTRVHLD